MTSASSVPALDLGGRYEALLAASPETSDEVALHAAYAIGREALNAGLGVLDLAGMHRRVLTRLLAARPANAGPVVDRVTRLFLESLVPFEMTHQGFREATAARRASEERYRELFENANDIVFSTDLKGQLTSVNRAGVVLTGYSHDEAMTLNIASLVAPEDAGILHALARLRRGAIEDGRTRHKLEIIARDGRRIPLEVSSRVVSENGRPVGIQGIARDITDRKRAESALRHLNQRLEEKAQRIAHALHDEAGQLLASVYLRVAEIAGDLPRQGRERLEELRTLLDQVDDQIRHLAHELRPTILDDLGLVPACEFLAEGVFKRSGVAVRVRGSTGGRLPPEVETALYRTVQEALSNATRHSRCQAITVEFTRGGRMLSGVIHDDGSGFDTLAVLEGTATKGLGLMGMRERLAALGGTFSIDSDPGRGTRIRFDVPLED